jgi:DNA-binding response OmpR family regulator
LSPVLAHDSHRRRPVLVVDADPDVREVLRTLLERSHHDVVCASEPMEALRTFYAARPKLVLLDVALGAHDGWAVLERIRELSADVPIMVVTKRASELEAVRAFGAGADDHVLKPFSGPELVARAAALLRRSRGAGPDIDVYDDGVVRIDPVRAEVSVAGRPVRLTPLEFRLLSALTRHRGQVLSCAQILRLVWHDEDEGAAERSGDEVRVYVGYLRRKLRDVLGEAVAIETVRGFGYRYEPAPLAALAA